MWCVEERPEGSKKSLVLSYQELLVSPTRSKKNEGQ
jgi:hypothetical protein